MVDFVTLVSKIERINHQNRNTLANIKSSLDRILEDNKHNNSNL